MDNKKRPDMINQMTDLFDEAIMKCYYGMIDEEKDNTDVTNYNIKTDRINYYDCFIKIVDYFLEEKELIVDEESKKVIDDALDTFRNLTEEFGINSEEIRRALLLIDIKAFKSINFPLDIITPDAIGIIISNILNEVFENKKEVEILDFNFGIGNLAFNIANHLKTDVKLHGIENHLLLSNVAARKAELLNQELNLYYDDALSVLPNDIDLIVSDIATFDYENDGYTSELYDKGVRYFPYLAIEHYLKIEKKIIGIYIIENTFFNKNGNKDFYEMMSKSGHIDALIMLPSNFFQNESDAKSLVIISNDVKNKTETGIYMLPNLNDRDAFFNKLEEVAKYIKKRKEEL